MACGPSTKKFKQSVLSFGILKNTCSQSSDSETPVVIEASNLEQASSGGHEVSDSISRLARVPTQMTKTLNSKVATESSEVQQTNAIEMIECICRKIAIFLLPVVFSKQLSCPINYYRPLGN